MQTNIDYIIKLKNFIKYISRNNNEHSKKVNGLVRFCKLSYANEFRNYHFYLIVSLDDKYNGIDFDLINGRYKLTNILFDTYSGKKLLYRSKV